MQIGVSNRIPIIQEYAFSHAPKGCRYIPALEIPWKHFGVHDHFLANTKYFLPQKEIDLYHTCNGIVANDRPWVIEIESALPHFSPMRNDRRLFQWGRKRLASQNCKHLLFTSKWALTQNSKMLEYVGVDSAKLGVINKAVPQFPSTHNQHNTFNILFAGKGFYRNGGLELLRALEAISHKEIRLTIVCNMEEEEATTQADTKWVQRMLQDPRITIIKGLAQPKLLNYMQAAHLFVSTTWTEPFNNAILEAMACGTPVICSNEGPQPEMVEQGRNGYRLDVERLTRQEVSGQLHQIILDLFNNSDGLEILSEQSTEIVAERFSLSARLKKLRSVYGVG